MMSRLSDRVEALHREIVESVARQAAHVATVEACLEAIDNYLSALRRRLHRRVEMLRYQDENA